MVLRYDKRLKKTEIGNYVAKEWNDRLVQVLKTFVKICDEHKLRYFVGCGSAIGAVRHKGMIPWDDDIDVMMPYPDYLKFIEICKTADLENCEVMDPHEDSSLYPSYILFADKNSSLMLWRRNLAVLGLFIDVFPLCGICDDQKEAYILYERMRRLQEKLSIVSNKYTFQNLLNFLKAGRTKHIFNYWRLTFNRKRTRLNILHEMDAIRNKYDYETSNNIVIFSYFNNPIHIYPKQWFESFVDMPFENLTVKLPGEYHKYLTYCYGDYMTPPPIEQRDDRHEFDYLNLKERKTREYILNYIKEEGR